MAESTAILVLGMHRSGTSATTGWLRTLGVNLGPYLMAEDPTQPKGYFEHPEITAMHNELMVALNSGWDDPRPLPEGWEHDRKVRSFRAQLMEIIRRDLATQPLWGAKDPRLCRLLPLWLGMLGELGTSVRAIFVLRHPAEVAESLALRNGFSADKSGLLWLRHVLEAERHSRCLPRVTLRYGDLLSDWRAESQRVAQGLGIIWPKPYGEAAPAATDFLTQELRHHESVYFDRFPPPLRRWIVSAYRALEQRTGPRDHARTILDSIHHELAPYDSYVRACWLERIRNLEFESDQTRARLEQLQVQFGQCQGETARIRADSELAHARLTQTLDELAHDKVELMQTQSQLAAADAELAQARGELERSRAVYRSRYCRITRPWRVLETYLRNRRRRRRETRRRRKAVQ